MNYEGFENMVLNDEQINSLFQEHKLYVQEENGERYASSLGILENEYLNAVNKDGSDIGIFKRKTDSDGDPYFEPIPYIKISNEIVGTIKPRNDQQRMALDLLFDPQTTIKVITGKFGTGEMLAPLCGDAYSKLC